DGRLVSLRWSAGAGAFATQDDRRIPDTGADAVLVAHERGITAVDPGGSVNQVGTGQDRTLRAAPLAAPLLGADFSPAGLGPVSSPNTAAIRLVRDDRVVQVDGAAFGCRNPAKTVVYRDRIYVACPGDRKVIVLDTAGRRGGADITTRGTPELVTNAGVLIVNVPDDST